MNGAVRRTARKETIKSPSTAAVYSLSSPQDPLLKDLYHCLFQ